MSAHVPHLALPLSADAARVDLWLMSPDALDEALRRHCLDLLDGDERARHDRYRAPAAQSQFLVSRALLRAVLACYADLSPADWRFDLNAYGKPRVADCLQRPGLHFNVSHTEGLVALAVSGLPDLGLDVEHAGRAVFSLEDLSARYFAPAEQALMAGMGDEAARARMFFDVWTLKESYIKARGTGLSLPLDSFGFQLPPSDVDGADVRLVCAPACGDDGARWQFHRARPTPQHVLALAAAAPTGRRLEVVTRWVASIQSGRPDRS